MNFYIMIGTQSDGRVVVAMVPFGALPGICLKVSGWGGTTGIPCHIVIGLQLKKSSQAFPLD